MVLFLRKVFAEFCTVMDGCMCVLCLNARFNRTCMCECMSMHVWMHVVVMKTVNVLIIQLYFSLQK